MNFPRRQRGATLLVGLIMLVLLTMIGLAASNTSTSYFRIISNSQYQAEASTAAQSALNQVMSHGNYFIWPATAPTEISVDINGDGAGDYTVALTQPCLLSAVTITLSELNDLTLFDRLQCKGSAPITNSGIFSQNVGSKASECSRVTWRVTATVNDHDITKAVAQITEGASVRMDRMLADAYKNDSTRRCAS